MSVTISYPTSGASMPGDGGFFAWGTVSSGDSVTSASAKWQAAAAGGEVGGAVMNVNGTSISPGPHPCNWAFEFADVAVGPTITLSIVANSGTSTITFTCSAARR